MHRSGQGGAGLLLIGGVLAACGGSSAGGTSTGGTSTGGTSTVPAPSTSSASPAASGTPVITDGVPIAQRDPALLTIGYIERLPRIDYVWKSASPTTEGWPAEGQAVTWRAHLINWSSSRLPDVDYSWRLDGVPAANGSFSPAGGETTLDLPWTWARARHELELRVGNSSFEDWMNFQVESYNLLLARALYPETPNGVLDRIRLDHVRVVADGALPLDPQGANVGGSFTPAQARPNLPDRSVDLQWGFPSDLLDPRYAVYTDRSSLKTSNQFYYSGFVQHEIGHARSMIDEYGFEVFHGTNGSRVDITENGQPIAGSRYLPGAPTINNGKAGLLLRETPSKGLMNAQWTFLDRHSAAAWNRIAGRRATAGNYNEPENIGDFLYDLPRENEVTVEDVSGRPLGGANVSVYQSTEPAERGVYAKYYDDQPDIQVRADGEGRARLGTNPFSATGRFVHSDVGYSNITVIVRVEHEGKVGYGFLEAADFNYEYWKGHPDLGRYELRVPLI